MNRKELQELQAIRDYPSVSILAPTHRTAPENRQDPIRVKNLVAEATSRLLNEYTKRDIEPLLDRLDFLIEEIDWRYTSEGIALFVNKEFASRFDLPFPVEERVMVDESFATRDLVFSLNRSPRYWVLVLSEQSTRLFCAVRDRFEEMETGSFPMQQTGPGSDEPLPGGPGVQKSARRDERDRQFFRQVDAELTKILQNDPLPIAVVGVERNIAFFKEVTSGDALIGTMEGSHARTSPHVLAGLVWPMMQQVFSEQREKIFDEISQALGRQQLGSGIGEVWQLAQQGRGEVLVVEEDFHYPAILHPSGLLLPPNQETPDAEFLGDAVDELIETVMQKGGRAVFVENGTLSEHDRIAMMLRW